MSYVNIPSYAWKEPVATAGELPLIGNSDGDARIVLSDNTLRIWDEGTSSWILSSGGTGDVVGPASSTDNAVVRFDSTTGKLIQNSVATLSDLGEFLAGNGSAALPAYSFSSNSDLGIYRSAANTLAFSTAGTQRGSINSTGAWVIGTANTAQTHTVNGDMRFGSTNATDATDLYRDSTTGVLSLQGSNDGSPSAINIYGSSHASLANILRFITAGSTRGEISSAGLWTIGSSGTTETHRLNTDTATSATAGANGDVPAQVVGYIKLNINGTSYRIPYYNA